VEYCHFTDTCSRPGSPNARFIPSSRGTPWYRYTAWRDGGP
jgi:hypothetical protein